MLKILDTPSSDAILQRIRAQIHRDVDDRTCNEAITGTPHPYNEHAVLNREHAFLNRDDAASVATRYGLALRYSDGQHASICSDEPHVFLNRDDAASVATRYGLAFVGTRKHQPAHNLSLSINKKKNQSCSETSWDSPDQEPNLVPEPVRGQGRLPDEKMRAARTLQGLERDFVFSKEVRLGTYSSRTSSLPPAAIVAMKPMRADPRAEPRYGERIPYIVVHGEPGGQLIDLVVDPLDVLDINSPYTLNDLYYIKKQIIPPLQRVFGLLGVDLNRWFSEMPQPVHPTLAKRFAVCGNAPKGRIYSKFRP
ncbi:DNA polymerase zeta catalytic subunit [Nymphaea thermarum]|nr:DNA polymerase zeta catalytic subunit [Nymphaea thermarum]